MKKKEKDIEVFEVEKTGAMLAAAGIAILSCIYFILEIAIKGETHYGWYSIIALYCVMIFGYKGIKLKKKAEIVTAVLWLLVFLITVFAYISNLIETSTIL